MVLKNTVKIRFLSRCRRTRNWNVSSKSGIAAHGAMTQIGASAVGGGGLRDSLLGGLQREQRTKLWGGARPFWTGSQWEQ